MFNQFWLSIFYCAIFYKRGEKVDSTFKWLLTKIEEIEYRLNKSKTKSEQENLPIVNLNTTIGQSLSAGEVEVVVGNATFYAKTSLVIDGDAIIWASKMGSARVVIYAGGFEVFNQLCSLNGGRNDIKFSAVINNYVEESVEIKLKVILDNAEGSEQATINVLSARAKIFSFMFADGEIGNISADFYNGKFAVCVSDGASVYVYNGTKIPSCLSIYDFNFYDNAIDGQVAITCNNGTDVCQVFLQKEGKVLLEKDAVNSIVVAEGVSKFSAIATENRSQVVLAYIKNGEPYYKLIFNGAPSDEVKISTNGEGEICEITAVKNCENITYLLLTTKSGDSYVYYAFGDMHFNSPSEKLDGLFYCDFLY